MALLQLGGANYQRNVSAEVVLSCAKLLLSVFRSGARMEIVIRACLSAVVVVSVWLRHLQIRCRVRAFRFDIC